MTMVEKITAAMLDTAVTIQPLLCTRCRTPKSDCAFCADLCPAGAITLSEAGPEIGPACLDCGVCYAACPTGALGRKQGDDTEIIAGFELPPGQATCRISCRRGAADADLLVSCLGRLTESLLLHPLHLNPDIRLQIMQPNCGQCQTNKAVATLPDLLTRIGHLYDLVGVGRERISVIGIPLHPLQPHNRPAGESGSRRAFLSAIRGKATEVMSKTPAPAAMTGPERPENHKRTALLASLRVLAEKGEMKAVTIPARESITAPLAVNSRCTACGACAAVCPAGALNWRKNSETVSLLWRADLCVNCGVCAGICRTGAVERQETIMLNNVLSSDDVELFAASRQQCRICRLDFVGQGTDGICPLCVDRYRRQQESLKNLFATS